MYRVLQLALTLVVSLREATTSKVLDGSDGAPEKRILPVPDCAGIASWAAGAAHEATRDDIQAIRITQKACTRTCILIHVLAGNR
jgi:hypothetical protein